MNIAVVGLGLIGGSIAKSIKKNTDYKVFGLDIAEEICSQALNDGCIDGVLKDFDNIDLVFICLSPEGITAFIEKNKDKFKKGCIVCDICGVKESIVNAAENLLYPDIRYVGTHPMAGKEVSGFKNSSDDLFKNASLIITITQKTDLEAVETVEQLAKPMGFRKTVKTTFETHDHVIAYTSQLAHIVSNAYIKSPTALNESGFSAGSFSDLTRVAVLDEKLWTSLFMLNCKNLISEIEILEKNLAEYKQALINKDSARLEELLKDGKLKKLDNLKGK